MRLNQLKSRTPVLFFFLFTVFAGDLMTIQGQAPKKAEIPPTSSLCTQESALEIIKQQLDTTKTFDDRIQRIAVLIATADLL